MFDLLSRYLFETAILPIPEIGTFRLLAGQASADAAAGLIAAPGWHVELLPDNEGNAESNTKLHHWLAAAKAISVDEAAAALAAFGYNLKERLTNSEEVVWPELGTLYWDNGHAAFAGSEVITPFTNVAAQKVIREDASYATIVGDVETTTAQMREQLAPPSETPRRGNTVVWVLLCLAGAAALWYFTQNGCNKAATGNRQPVETATPGDTYKLK